MYVNDRIFSFIYTNVYKSAQGKGKKLPMTAAETKLHSLHDTINSKGDSVDRRGKKTFRHL